jgi:outer membrane receptor protein involved in Fe transport
VLAALLVAAHLGAGGAAAAADDPTAGEHQEEVTVTATGVAGPPGTLASAATVLTDTALENTPALSLDEALRATPGFALFRRSGSRTANPTAQGASLRGLGGSATSRALVLADGVPLVDPFGGWVHWGRLPTVAIERVEVVRGGASGLYGSGALSGVIQLFRRGAEGNASLVEAQAGGQGTASASLWGSTRRAPWSAAGTFERFTSRGYVPLAAADRGPVDRRAGSQRSTGEITLARESARAHLFARGSSLRERRDNGTALQVNSTDLEEATLGGDLTVEAGTLSFRAWSLTEEYEQTFSAIDGARVNERLIRDQTVPSRATGGSARWIGSTGSHTLLAGVDGRHVEGKSQERAYLASGAIVGSATGGEQEAWAVWVEDVAQLAPRWSSALALRYDGWRNQERRDGVGARADALSPRVALRFQPRTGWGVAAAAYGAFRAPTLNELYRGFRVGDVITDPNPRLGPERLRGAELGADWRLQSARALRLQGTVFWMELEDAITNVTLATGPDGIRRRRENVGRTRSRGIEVEAAARLARPLSLRFGGQLVDARVMEFAADPSLVDRRVAQVPREQLTLALDWQRDNILVTVQGRWAGDAFDDDRNSLSLGEQRVVDLRAARELAGGEAFVAVENLFDASYAVGRTPLTTVGSPRLARAGVRWRFGTAH